MGTRMHTDNNTYKKKPIYRKYFITLYSTLVLTSLIRFKSIELNTQKQQIAYKYYHFDECQFKKLLIAAIVQFCIARNDEYLSENYDMQSAIQKFIFETFP